MIKIVKAVIPAFLVLVLLCFIISCSNSKNTKLAEDKTIERQKMIQLMADMDITEAALRLKQSKISRDSLDEISNKAYDSLYLYYQVTPEMFYENLKYYQSNMVEYEEMMEEKITLLSKKKDSISMEDKKADTSEVTKKATL